MFLFNGSKTLILTVASADVLCFIAGTSSSWTSPILPKLQSNDSSNSPLNREITQVEASWIGSLLSMDGIFSPLVFAFWFSKIGRKTASLISVVPFLVAYLTAAFAKDVALFYLSRILMGIGTAAMFCSIPIYIVEIAEDTNRGFLSASTGVFLVGGIFFSYAVGSYVSIMVFNILLSVICILYLLIFWSLAKETPYYLLKNNKEAEASISLQFFRKTNSSNELENIKKYLSSLSKASYVDIFLNKINKKAFFFSLILTDFQQLSGINVIFTYMQTIFDLAGSTIPSEICSIIVGAVQLVFSFISPSLSDKLGRKTLMLISTLGASISLCVLGIYFYFYSHNYNVSDFGWLPLVTLIVFMMFYNCGMGSLPWAIISEILPSNVISKAYPIITSFYWIIGWVLSQYFADLVNAVGSAGSFWIFSALCFIHFIFIFVFLFETKGKSFLEIAGILKR